MAPLTELRLHLELSIEGLSSDAQNIGRKGPASPYELQHRKNVLPRWLSRPFSPQCTPMGLDIANFS